MTIGEAAEGSHHDEWRRTTSWSTPLFWDERKSARLNDFERSLSLSPCFAKDRPKKSQSGGCSEWISSEAVSKQESLWGEMGEEREATAKHREEMWCVPKGPRGFLAPCGGGKEGRWS